MQNHNQKKFEVISRCSVGGLAAMAINTISANDPDHATTAERKRLETEEGAINIQVLKVRAVSSD